jgi:hypothetical protein
MKVTSQGLGALALGGAMLLALVGCDRMASGMADPDAAVAVGRVKEGFGSQAAAVQGFTAQAAAAATSQAAGGPAAALALAGQAARAEGARALGVPPEQVTLVSVDATQWPDASLGCPEAGKSYAPAITPGFRAIVSVAGQRHELHADAAGRAVVCPAPTK